MLQQEHRGGVDVAATRRVFDADRHLLAHQAAQHDGIAKPRGQHIGDVHCGSGCGVGVHVKRGPLVGGAHIGPAGGVQLGAQGAAARHGALVNPVGGHHVALVAHSEGAAGPHGGGVFGQGGSGKQLRGKGGNGVYVVHGV